MTNEERKTTVVLEALVRIRRRKEQAMKLITTVLLAGIVAASASAASARLTTNPPPSSPAGQHLCLHSGIDCPAPVSQLTPIKLVSGDQSLLVGLKPTGSHGSIPWTRYVNAAAIGSGLFPAFLLAP
jgi:hypothetical protein